MWQKAILKRAGLKINIAKNKMSDSIKRNKNISRILSIISNKFLKMSRKAQLKVQKLFPKTRKPL